MSLTDPQIASLVEEFDSGGSERSRSDLLRLLCRASIHLSVAYEDVLLATRAVVSVGAMSGFAAVAEAIQYVRYGLVGFALVEEEKRDLLNEALAYYGDSSYEARDAKSSLDRTLMIRAAAQRIAEEEWI